MKNGDLYNPFISAFRERYLNQKTPSNIEKEGLELWNSIKDDRDKIQETTRRLKAEAGTVKAKSTLDYSWSQAAKRRAISEEPSSSSQGR